MGNLMVALKALSLADKMGTKKAERKVSNSAVKLETL
jgi:hypothetical protein